MRKTCLKLYQACLVLGAMLHPFEPSPRMYYFCVPLRKTPKNTWYGVFCLTCTQCGRAGRSAKQGKAWKIMIKTILWQLNDIFCRHFCHKLLSTDSWYFLLPPLLGVAAGSLVVAQIHLYWDQSLGSSSWSWSKFCTMIIIITIVIIMYLDGNERSVVVAASVGEIGGGKTWDGRESQLLHFIRHIQAQYNYRGNKT